MIGFTDTSSHTYIHIYIDCAHQCKSEKFIDLVNNACKITGLPIYFTVKSNGKVL